MIYSSATEIAKAIISLNLKLIIKKHKDGRNNGIYKYTPTDYILIKDLTYEQAMEIKYSLLQCVINEQTSVIEALQNRLSLYVSTIENNINSDTPIGNWLTKSMHNGTLEVIRKSKCAITSGQFIIE